jgi:hypothetical protein
MEKFWSPKYNDIQVVLSCVLVLWGVCSKAGVDEEGDTGVHIAWLKEIKYAYKILIIKIEKKTEIGGPPHEKDNTSTLVEKTKNRRGKPN